MKYARYLVYIAVAAGLATAVASAVQADSACPAVAQPAMVNLELKNTPIKDAIGALFQGTGLKYYIQSGVSGKVVELKLKGVTLDQALGALTDAAGLIYRIDDGCYVIGPAPASFAAPVAKAAPVAPKQVLTPAPEVGAGPAPGEPPPMMQERQPPIIQRIEGGSANVSISQPAAPSYGGCGYGGPGCGDGSYQFGSVGVIGGWPGISVVGASPYMIQSVQPPPPPPGWVGPDLMRFLRTQYVIRNRIGITYPYYYNYGNGYGYGY